MKTVKIGFDPRTLDPDSEAYPAFMAGGITLKFWALYKPTHMTSQHFRPFLVALGDYFRAAFDAEDDSAQPYTNIDEFMRVLDRCGASRSGTFGSDLPRWVAEHWDFFNLNIQRAVALEYEAIETVTKTLVVGALTGRELI